MNIEELKELAKKDLKIDTLNLDTESLSTPVIYGRWLDVYHIEIDKLDKMTSLGKKLRFSMTRYYAGKAPSEAYTKKPLNESLLKSEIEKFIDASDDWLKYKDEFNIQSNKVDYIEKILKQIANRGFSINAAIEWRKFQSGR